jgi:hypothetical protein
MEKLKSFLCFILLTFSACASSDKPVDFDYGVVENSQYKNKFFNFTLDIPVDWKIKPKGETKELSNQPNVTDDEKLPPVIESANDISNATLLAVDKYAPGTVVMYNPNITIVTENITGVANIKTGGDYLINMMRLLKKTNPAYKSIDETLLETQLGGKSFHSVSTSLSLMGTDINQRYYASIINDFSLIIIISYSTSDQLSELTGVLESMKFGM